MTSIDWLREESSLRQMNEEDILYSIDKIKLKFEVRDLPTKSKSWLVLNHKGDRVGLWVMFAVLQFVESDMNGDNPQGELVFHGEGPSGNLRECRHTWWGENGYVFYPNGPIISAAFKELAEFFDGMI